jgi:chromatin remodeling complex protein RSC6
MVRSTKTDKLSATPAVIASPPIVSATSTENVVVKKTKAPKAKVETLAAPAATVVDTPVTSEVVEASAVDSTTESVSIAVKLSEYGSKLQQWTILGSTLKNDFKTLEKAILRDLKNAQKYSQRKKKPVGQRKPSGFTKPAPITDELANFLGKSLGSELARTEVSKEINNYVKEHNLKDKDNGRIIHADEKLKKLLNLKDGDDQLTYFNLQRYIKHHFVKATPVVSATA